MTVEPRNNVMTEADVERFLKKIKKTDTCWLWTASTRGGGYGSFKLHSRTVLAHRVSYILFNGDLSINDVVRHSCDTPSCVNPSHLLLGSCADNVADRVARGRSAVGQLNGQSKLTREIVTDCRKSKETSIVLAKKYGVGISAMERARRGTTWK